MRIQNTDWKLSRVSVNSISFPLTFNLIATMKSVLSMSIIMLLLITSYFQLSQTNEVSEESKYLIKAGNVQQTLKVDWLNQSNDDVNVQDIMYGGWFPLFLTAHSGHTGTVDPKPQISLS